jgi:hypothetical protein
MILHGFADLDDLKQEYQITDEDLDGCTILFACYEIEGYEGCSTIILEKDGKLWINEAGHCSCYGLEGQWDPIETNLEALKKEAKAKSHNSNYTTFCEFVDTISGF